MSLQGSLSELPLPDVIQLVSVSGKTGAFDIQSSEAEGRIFLRDGQIVDAVVGLRVTQEEEVRGLDITLHDERGYITKDPPVLERLNREAADLDLDLPQHRLATWAAERSGPTRLLSTVSESLKPAACARAPRGRALPPAGGAGPPCPTGQGASRPRPLPSLDRPTARITPKIGRASCRERV
mgnify:CR=1 FL=1